MELSKLQLEILSTKLSNILSEGKRQLNDDDFINNIEFEEMLCLATNIDYVYANALYQKIYRESDKTMSLSVLSETIAKHVSNINIPSRVTLGRMITNEEYEQIKKPLRDFCHYLQELNGPRHYVYHNADTIRDEFPEIAAKEKELNKIVQSVLHTEQEYDWLAFRSENLPTKYGLDCFFNS